MLKLNRLKINLILATLVALCINPIQAQSSPLSDGTSSGGGGNGFNNVALESYIVDIEKLPAYINFLKPMFDRIKQQQEERQSLREKNDPESESSKMYKKLSLIQSLLTKTWYMAPVKLKPLPNEAIGISFSADQSQQLAIQGKSAIWVDKNIFDQMPEEKQALLILHEIIMEIYFLKSKTIFQMCSDSAKKNNFNIDCKDSAFIDNLIGIPEFITELSSQDYENIRNTTHYLFSNRETISEFDFIVYLHNHNFHHFVFNPEFIRNESDQAKSESAIHLTHAEQKNSISRLKNLRKEFDTCLAFDLNEEFPCTMKYTENIDNVDFKYYIKDADGQTHERLFNVIRDEILISNNKNLNLSFRFSEKMNNGLSLSNQSGFSKNGKSYWTGLQISDACLGIDTKEDCLGKEFTYLVYFYTEREVMTGGIYKKAYDLVAIAHFKQIYTEFKKDEKGVTSCLSEKPEATVVENDTVVVYRKKDSSLIEEIKKLIPIYAQASLCPTTKP